MTSVWEPGSYFNYSAARARNGTVPRSAHWLGLYTFAYAELDRVALVEDAGQTFLDLLGIIKHAAMGQINRRNNRLDKRSGLFI